MFNFGQFCLGAFTGDPKGEGEHVDFELLEVDAVEGGTVGYGS